MAAFAQARHSRDLSRGQGFYRASWGVELNRVGISRISIGRISAPELSLFILYG